MLKFSHRFKYSWRTWLSWINVDSRNMACHCLWAVYRWERR